MNIHELTDKIRFVLISEDLHKKILAKKAAQKFPIKVFFLYKFSESN